MTAALAALLGAAAQAAPIPDAIEAMIRAASPAELGAVEAVAKRAAPDSEAEIAALARSIRDARKAGEAERIAAQGFFDGWSGEGALGGSMSSGNTDEFGVSASLGLDKRTTRWEHDLRLSFDYLETNGAVQRERVYAGYTGRFDLSGDAFFSFGLLSFERDRFSGIDYRLTGSLGLGYRLVQNDDFSWTVEGGPAFRQTGFTDGVETGRLDLLGRTDLEWKPSSTLTLTQAAGGLLSGGNSSLFSKSAATAKLGGTLSARLSVDVLYESEPPAGRDTTDIISRASIVYGF
jgi:putative salt-induced outer membrane protein